MVTLRHPSMHPQSSESFASSSATPHPKISWLQGTWHVTHSTLPMWKSSRNVRITYTPVPNTSPPHLDDLVSYQKLKSKALKTVHGVDKPFATDATVKKDADATVVADTTTTDDTASLGYNWRGKGWLAIASSKWEILGYGDEEDTDNQWVVTYFAKTLFTPAGIDLYSRKGGLKPDTVESIKAGLAGLGGDLPKLATSIFEITVDGARDA